MTNLQAQDVCWEIILHGVWLDLLEQTLMRDQN